MRRTCTITAVTVLAIVGWDTHLPGADPPKIPEPPPEIKFETASTSLGYLEPVVVVVDEGIAKGAEAKVHLFHNRETILRYSASFDPLRTGDLIPVLGRVYRVEWMTQGELPGGRRWAIMKTKRLDPKDVPKGVTLRPMSVIVPYTPAAEGGTKFMGGLLCFVRCYSEAAGYKPARARVQVGLKGDEYRKEAMVKVGEFLLVGDRGYEVLSITPPNEKTKVVGWVELAPKGVPEKELADRKAPVVRPEKPAAEKKEGETK